MPGGGGAVGRGEGTVAHAACHTSARMQGEVAGGSVTERSGTPIVGRIGAGYGPYRGGSAVGRGGGTVAHAARVAQMNECRIRLLVALARARQGVRGGPQTL